MSCGCDGCKDYEQGLEAALAKMGRDWNDQRDARIKAEAKISAALAECEEAAKAFDMGETVAAHHLIRDVVKALTGGRE